jgi:hypothetical protein
VPEYPASEAASILNPAPRMNAIESETAIIPIRIFAPDIYQLIIVNPAYHLTCSRKLAY